MAKARYYRPELDAIRFLAFLGVFLHHVIPRKAENYSGIPHALAQLLAGFANACAFGLPLFFFLSAYLIGTLLLMESAETGHIHLGAFYVRRILRIWPLYFLGLGIALIYALATHNRSDFPMLVWFAAFVANIYFQFHDWTTNIMAPLWSISVEEQFYLAFPVLLIMLGARRVVPLSLAAIVLSLITLGFEGHRHLSIDPGIWTNTLSQLIFFGAGSLCAAFNLRVPWNPAPHIRTMLITTCILLAVCASLFDVKHWGDASSGVEVVIGYSLVALSCACLLHGLLNTRQRIPDTLIYLGRISYGLYVYHQLVLYLTAKVIYSHPAQRLLGEWVVKWSPLLKLGALVPLIVVAGLSYRYFESPFLRFRKLFTFVENNPDIGDPGSEQSEIAMTKAGSALRD